MALESYSQTPVWVVAVRVLQEPQIILPKYGKHHDIARVSLNPMCLCRPCARRDDGKTEKKTEFFFLLDQNGTPVIAPVADP